ncbi:hypothetical protein HKX48_009108 [Thoreauomyces humboldtii]|nr:hypothetical protein HKX48_009108 [Thoreauomyces humboldtii]
MLPSAANALLQACIVGFTVTVPNSTSTDGTAFCTTQVRDLADGLAKEISGDFGGPNIVLGASIPIMVTGGAVAVLRLRKIQNARSWYLLVGTLGNILLASAMISVSSSFKIEASRASDMGGIVGADITVTFLALSGITRFVQVLARADRRRQLERCLGVGLFLFQFVIIYMAHREVWASKVHPTQLSFAFDAMLYTPIIVYTLGGLFCFSWNLPSFSVSSDNASDPFTTLKTLRLINDVGMAIVILLCLGELGVIVFLRATMYNNQAACLFASLILFVENMFETVNNGLRGRNLLTGAENLRGGGGGHASSIVVSRNHASRGALFSRENGNGRERGKEREREWEREGRGDAKVMTASSHSHDEDEEIA